MTQKPSQDQSDNSLSFTDDKVTAHAPRTVWESMEDIPVKEYSDYMDEGIRVICRRKIQEYQSMPKELKQSDLISFWEYELNRLNSKTATILLKKQQQSNPQISTSEDKTKEHIPDAIQDIPFEMSDQDFDDFLNAIMQVSRELNGRKRLAKKKDLEHYQSLSMAERVEFVKSQTPDEADWMKMGWDDLYDLVFSSIGEQDEITPDMAAFIGHPNLAERWVREVVDDGSDEEYQLLFKNKKNSENAPQNLDKA